uniref:putative disease resistance protein RGA3 isoform X1 n=1 Tax=Fragaria vesca subsp. vesca TaxID=101020 RepID=UPI0005CAF565|nr:PREDICTED: putative disease resistance protein RGA3 isoform X1 [Fragaria vesca subsp. vesca]XP_011469808.1 PREDICTED: putative disease resistance protein RGA3 isoform X1 [Fragaria vesca subsp. vesca]
MAGVLVDVLLERFATLALDKIEQEMKLVVGVKQEIKNLTKKLEAIQAVLEDAEQRQVTEASVRCWLSELTEVSFDMDDVLDEWITKVLRRQLEKQEKQSSKALVSNKKKVLPSLGKLASLESLTIQYQGVNLYGVSKVGVEFLGIEQGKTSSSSIFISFPKLKQLTIHFMPSWEELEGVEEENSEKITIMPCLSELTIYDCQKLKALPDFLWKTPLQKLRISGSPILENLYRKEIGEQWAKISHIPNTKVGW